MELCISYKYLYRCNHITYIILRTVFHFFLLSTHYKTSYIPCNYSFQDLSVTFRKLYYVLTQNGCGKIVLIPAEDFIEYVTKNIQIFGFS